MIVAPYTYRQGDRGRVVRDVQAKVGAKVDGLFGPKTDAAVRAYQAANGLAVDGIAGPKTLAAMGCELVAGIDVSHHNGAVDWAKVAGAGVAFAWSKASEGQTYRDKTARTNVSGARANGVKVGVYHFARPEGSLADAEGEARNLSSAMATLGALDLPPVLDIESNPQKLTGAALVAWCARFCEVTTALVGRRPVIYTFVGFLPLLATGDELAGFPLWIARLSSGNDPGPVAPWTTWTAWQQQIGPVPGCPTPTDRNWLAGGRAGLDALCAAP